MNAQPNRMLLQRHLATTMYNNRQTSDLEGDA